MKYILSLDQGTTSSRAVLFDKSGNICGVEHQEFKQIFPQPGWVEHDPIEIWNTQLAVARAVLSNNNCRATDIAAIGITNQRETTIVWDRRTGEPIGNAVVWQDRRTAEFCDSLRRNGNLDTITQKTGLVLDPYFSGTKVRWILDNTAGARERANAGELAFGTVDCWLLWKLTAGQTHVTDATNASRTLMYNIHSGQWDEELLNILDIPMSMLPEVRSCSEIYAQANPDLLGHEIPVAGIAGDQHAALFGQICTTPGKVKNTYGTGCFMMMFTGDVPVSSQNNLLTTVAWKLGDRHFYALEGSVFIAGAVVQWLRDGLGIIKSAQEVEALAAQVSDSGGCLVVPAFTGLGAPYWDPHARGIIAGITRGTSAAHIARAALDSIAHQTVDVLEAMNADSGIKIDQLRADGGATANNLLMQTQADLLGVDVICPKVLETTALGAAYFAGLAVGFWRNMEEISEQWQLDRQFSPEMTGEFRDKQRAGWAKAVERSRNWEGEN